MVVDAPGTHQPWYWLDRSHRSLSLTRKDFNYLYHFSLEKWLKIFIFAKINSICQLLSNHGNLIKQTLTVSPVTPVNGRQTDDLSKVSDAFGVTEISFNTLRPRQDGRRFTDDNFRNILLNKNILILINIWSLFIRVKLTIIQHCSDDGLVLIQATSHYRNQWW